MVSGPVYYDDWLSLDLKNVSEEILWLHSVEVFEAITHQLVPSMSEICLIQESIYYSYVGVLWPYEATVQEYAG